MKSNNISTPKFITFEGCEGSGKSTQSKILHEYLLEKNIQAVHTREIGGTKEAEKIRDLLLSTELLSISELMLVMAARYEHLHKIILPALANKQWVICDRFIDSTACYQSASSSISMNKIYDAHNEFMRINGKIIMPDLTFFMNLKPTIGVPRAMLRGNINKFDSKAIEFHNVIYDKFQSIAAQFPQRVISIECLDQSIDAIHQMITLQINQII